MENHQLSISSATNSSFTVTDKHDTAFSPTATITVDPEAQLEKGDATTTDTPAAAGPPDGGYGWVVVACSFLNNFAMLGIMFSWGIFQQLYSTDIFPGKASSVSWIGTLAFGFMYICGGCFSMFAARIGYRKMICTGSFLVGGGLIAASFSTEIWQLYLSQGILFGIGAAMANPCVLAAPAQWFVRRRGMASGIAISGSGIGGLVFSVVIEKMNASIGHRWCLRVLGIVVFCSMMTAGTFIRQFNSSGKRAVSVSMADVQIMKQPAFIIMVSGVLLTSFGYFSPLNLLPSYAVDHNLSQAQGAMINSFLNGASFFGRFAGGIFGDRFGLVNLTLCCVAASALTTLVIWMFATSLPVLLVYVILYGLMGGGFISLLAPVLAEQFGVSNLTILVGVTFGVNGVGSLLGTPIATAILASTGTNNYKPSIGFIGGVMALASCMFFVLKLKVGGKQVRAH
ncbi:hypothetical protein CPB97_003234 [Podila verticillata]|nr:hypothetical protein CPB97_003234 [Podila verticillata]